MLQIRFNRIGRKNRAIFRIVLQEHTIAPGGKHVEILGSWDPHLKKGVFSGEKIKGWIAKGAQVTDSVWNLLIRENIIEGKKRAVKINPVKSGEAGTQDAESSGVKKTAVTEEQKAEAKTGEIKKEEVKTEETAKEEIKTGEMKAEENKAEVVGEIKTEAAKTEETPKEPIKTEEVKTEEDKTEKTEEKPKAKTEVEAKQE